MSSTMKTILSLIVVAAIVVAIILFGGSNEDGALTSEESAEIVAVAGEEEITRGEVQQALAMFQQNPQLQQVTEEQVLTQLVNQKLLYQKAIASGVVVSQEEVDTAYDQAVTSFGSESALEAELGFSGNDFQEFLEEQLTTQEYVNSLREEFNVTVSDEEIQAAFDQFATQADEEVLLEDVEASIVQFLEEQAFQEELAQEIDALQDEFDVEIIANITEDSEEGEAVLEMEVPETSEEVSAE